MKTVLTILLLMATLGSGTFVFYQWGEKQAFLIYSRHYLKALKDLDQTWKSEGPYPMSQKWSYDHFLARRWELLNRWGRNLVLSDRRLSLKSEVARLVGLTLAQNLDFRDQEKMKFYILELESLISRIPLPEINGQHMIIKYVGLEYTFHTLLIEENARLFSFFYKDIQRLERMLNNTVTSH